MAPVKRALRAKGVNPHPRLVGLPLRQPSGPLNFKRAIWLSELPELLVEAPNSIVAFLKTHEGSLDFVGFRTQTPPRGVSLSAVIAS